MLLCSSTPPAMCMVDMFVCEMLLVLLELVICLYLHTSSSGRNHLDDRSAYLFSLWQCFRHILFRWSDCRGLDMGMYILYIDLSCGVISRDTTSSIFHYLLTTSSAMEGEMISLPSPLSMVCDNMSVCFPGTWWWEAVWPLRLILVVDGRSVM